MSCCAAQEYNEDDINGVCQECGEPTVDGEAYEVCHDSPILCDDCGYAPCDQSC